MVKITLFICRPKSFTNETINEVFIKVHVDEGDFVLATFEAEVVPEGTVFYRPELTVYTPLKLKDGKAVLPQE